MGVWQRIAKLKDRVTLLQETNRKYPLHRANSWGAGYYVGRLHELRAVLEYLTRYGSVKGLKGRNKTMAHKSKSKKKKKLGAKGAKKGKKKARKAKKRVAKKRRAA